jgi:TATA-binding protein-associated factor Taf7
MLQHFGLTDKVLAINADNATLNDTQVKALAAMTNSFNEENHVRCFNHTLQLTAKLLIKPFNSGMCSKAGSHDDDIPGEDDDMPELSALDNEDDDEERDVDEDGGEEGDDVDDNINELEALSEIEQADIIADTHVVRQAVTKVRVLHILVSLS